MPPDLRGALADAGLADGRPVSLAVAGADGTVDELCSGAWPDGSPVRSSDRFYAASLAKQLTGAAAALLVREGRLDPDAAVATHVPELPGWAGTITVADLAHHTAGLPEQGPLEDGLGTGHWTSAYVLGLLRDLSDLPHAPGAAHIYSNAGYILLAEIVARRSGLAFPEFVAERMLRPHSLAGMFYLTEPDTALPQLPLLGPPLPLSVGDGGLWTTARDFARWLALMNADAFGIADIVNSPGRLADGGAVDYGWGIGLGRRGGKPVYTHGGGWQGVRCRAVRMPDPGVGIVVLATADPEGAIAGLVDRLLDTLDGPVE